MALSSLEKKELIGKFGREKEDTGSPEVQIAMLSANIDSLNVHFKVNNKASISIITHETKEKNYKNLISSLTKNKNGCKLE